LRAAPDSCNGLLGDPLLCRDLHGCEELDLPCGALWSHCTRLWSGRFDTILAHPLQVQLDRALNAA